MESRIHKYKQGDNYIVLDVNSGGVHLVDKIIYDRSEEHTSELQSPS